MPFSTRLTVLLRIEHPIVLDGMIWVRRAELAAAMSNAGGLGMLTALIQATLDDLRREIERCRALTDRPFGVNLTLLPSVEPPYSNYSRAIVESGVRIVDVTMLVKGARECAALTTGDVDGRLIWTGQVQGLIHDIRDCAELIARFIDDATAIIGNRLAGMMK